MGENYKNEQGIASQPELSELGEFLPSRQVLSILVGAASTTMADGAYCDDIHSVCKNNYNDVLIIDIVL